MDSNGLPAAAGTGTMDNGLGRARPLLEPPHGQQLGDVGGLDGKRVTASESLRRIPSPDDTCHVPAAVAKEPANDFTDKPASASFKIEMICVSVNRDRFI